MDTTEAKLDPEAILKDFPILNQRIHRDRRLVYLDSGASSQRPQSVIDAMSDCYRSNYANVHRGIHYLSEAASDLYEQARRKVQQFIGAGHTSEVIFTSGTTAAINTVARSFFESPGRSLEKGDRILLTIMDHHSNIVPWQQLAERTGAVVEFIGLTGDCRLDMGELKEKLAGNTRLFAFPAISNVTGLVLPVQELCELASANNVATVVDAAQHVPHEPTDVSGWGADFVAFSGHKMLGPSGIGILYGKRQLLEEMPPFLGGGSMISGCTIDGFTPGELPAKFEAGTPPIVEAIGLGAAIDYLSGTGLNAISRHEKELTVAMHDALSEIGGLRILGPAPDLKAGLVSFVVDGLSAQDISIFLDRQGFAIRAGHHCAMPLHEYLGVANSCRASFYLYNSMQEVSGFAEALGNVIAKLK
ncbi:MAG: SufS family cysteine desulfurase [Planctomycetota bacterium]